MHLSPLRALLFLVIVAALDLYLWTGLRAAASGWAAWPRRLLYVVFWSAAALEVTFILGAALSDAAAWPKWVRNAGLGLLMSVVAGKLLLLAVWLGEDITRGARLGVESVFGESEPIPRSAFLARLAVGLASIPVLALLYGMVRGGTQYKVHRLSLRFPNLPPGFDGLRVVQLSDIHIGTFLDDGPLRRAFALVQAQKPDLILFTGDLVNNESAEAEPYRAVLSSLQAPMGVFAILGNHDYGDYRAGWTAEQRRADTGKLVRLETEAGWTVLLNEHRILERNGDRLALAGCQNWGTRFVKHGDLDATLRGLDEVPFTLLMSHDPTHWDAQIRDHPHAVDLTLSGHTHGMQFGLELGRLRWSPVQWVYKRWAGLYRESRHLLYVNRGLGMIGYPGRFGIWPEITALELKRG